jgi:hypothetical protein
MIGIVHFSINFTLGIFVQNSYAQTLGQITVALSLIVGLLGAAPFTPAILLIAFLLPTAAFVSWRGAIFEGLLSLLLCIIALIISPLRIVDLFESSFAVAWLIFCSAVVVFGAVRQSKSRR